MKEQQSLLVAAGYLLGNFGRYHLVVIVELDNGQSAPAELVRHFFGHKNSHDFVVLDEVVGGASPIPFKTVCFNELPDLGFLLTKPLLFRVLLVEFPVPLFMGCLLFPHGAGWCRGGNALVLLAVDTLYPSSIETPRGRVPKRVRVRVETARSTPPADLVLVADPPGQRVRM